MPRLDSRSESNKGFKTMLLSLKICLKPLTKRLFSEAVSSGTTKRESGRPSSISFFSSISEVSIFLKASFLICL